MTEPQGFGFTKPSTEEAWADDFQHVFLMLVPCLRETVKAPPSLLVHAIEREKLDP